MKEHGNPSGKVHVLGEEWEQYAWKRNHHRNPIWGSLFIIAGIVLLLNTLGFIPWDVWQHIIYFWPVLFILWGIQIIAGRSGIAHAVVSLLTIIFALFIALFAMTQVNPVIGTHLPKQITDILSIMKGIRQ